MVSRKKGCVKKTAPQAKESAAPKDAESDSWAVNGRGSIIGCGENVKGSILLVMRKRVEILGDLSILK